MPFINTIWPKFNFVAQLREEDIPYKILDAELTMIPVEIGVGHYGSMRPPSDIQRDHQDNIKETTQRPCHDPIPRKNIYWTRACYGKIVLPSRDTLSWGPFLVTF